MMKPIDLSIAKGAIFSEDRKYRYALWRVWSPSKPLLMGVCLNPSIASELADDPTITRLMARANREGYGGFLMANLYAYVTTYPSALLKNGDSVGELTDYYIKEMVKLTERQFLRMGFVQTSSQESGYCLSYASRALLLGYKRRWAAQASVVYCL